MVMSDIHPLLASVPLDCEQGGLQQKEDGDLPIEPARHDNLGSYAT